MSTHPNVILLCRLTPDDLARKTMRSILDEYNDSSSNEDVKIGDYNYHTAVLEEEWLEGYQIGGKEGDLLFFDMATYGYGEEIKWSDLEARKNELDEWAKVVCDKHSCKYEIVVTANYW